MTVNDSNPLRRQVLKGALLAPLAAAATARAQAAGVAIDARWELYLLVDQSSGANRDLAAQMLAMAVQNAGGSMLAGSVVETGSISRDGEYSIISTSTGTGLLASVWKGRLVREARGSVIGGKLVTARYAETRGDRAPMIATADRAAHSIRFDRSGRESTVQQMPEDPTDLASLPWMFAGRKLPTAPFTADYTNGERLYRANFDVASDKVESSAGTIDAVRVTSRRNQPDDPRVDLWLRRADGVPVRVRIDLDVRYGAIIEQRRVGTIATVAFGAAR
ncbi:hypothetical protein BH09PSE6_BH09PSE6_05220 [soil metagenome]